MSGESLKIKTLLLMFGIALIYSCEYEPSGTYKKTVNQDVVPPEIQIIELNLNEDTIYLFADTIVRFQFFSEDQSIRKVVFNIDSGKSTELASNAGTFKIDYEKLYIGIHTLRIEIITSSGTGSIADHLGTEGFTASKTWILIALKTGVAKTLSSINDGLLKLSWDKYPAPDLKEYIIYRGIYRGEPMKEMARVTSNELIDTTYVGEGFYYIIMVNTNNGRIIPWSGLELKENLPSIGYYNLGNDKHAFYWSRPKFYNAVDTFILEISFDNKYFYKVKATLDYRDSLCYPDIVHFGDDVRVRLKLVPKKNNVLYSVNREWFETFHFWFRIGEIFSDDKVTSFKQVGKYEFLYHSDYDTLYKYSVSENRIVEKLSYKLGCYCGFCKIRYSPKGMYFINILQCTSNDLMIAQTNDMQNYLVTDRDSIINIGLPVSVSAVSDTGTALMQNNEGFYVYDFNNHSILGFHRIITNTFFRNLKMSPNGNYIYYTYDIDSTFLIEFKNSEFKIVHSQKNIGRYFEFNPLIPDQLVFWEGSVFYIKSCSDFSNIREFPLTDTYLLNIDYHNNEFLTFVSKHLYIRSLTDGSILKDIPIRATNFSDMYYLINRTLIRENGFINFIKDE